MNATALERKLTPMKTEVRGLVANAPAYTFIRTYFVSTANRLESLMNFEGIVPAKEANFFPPAYGEPYYESNLNKAFAKVSKLKSNEKSLLTNKIPIKDNIIITKNNIIKPFNADLNNINSCFSLLLISKI